MFLILLVQSALAGSVCADGWVSSSSGSGTCSHHGGVSKGTAYFAPPFPTLNDQSDRTIVTKDGLDLRHCAVSAFAGNRGVSFCDGFKLEVVSGTMSAWDRPYASLADICQETALTNLPGNPTLVCWDEFKYEPFGWGIDDLDFSIKITRLDSDSDGVADLSDSCPDAPEDFDKFSDNDGCPDPDNDKDTVPDVVDRCLNDAENINGVSDEDGCPEPEVIKLTSGKYPADKKTISDLKQAGCFVRMAEELGFVKASCPK